MSEASTAVGSDREGPATTTLNFPVILPPPSSVHPGSSSRATETKQSIAVPPSLTIEPTERSRRKSTTSAKTPRSPTQPTTPNSLHAVASRPPGTSSLYPLTVQQASLPPVEHIIHLPSSLEMNEQSSAPIRSFLGRAIDYWRTLLTYLGPGYMIAVGYMDPGNWATDLAAGSTFNYSLLHIVLISNLMAVLLQSLAIKLGIATDRDLAANCRANFNPRVNFVLWLLAEFAIIATDLAEVIGTAIALNLLFNVPVLWGVFITGLDVLVILLGWQERTLRFFEMGIGLLVAGVGVCFTVLLVDSRPNFGDLMVGFVPTPKLFSEPGMLYLAMGIIGATIMPHNLYLHSNIVLYRRREAEALAKSEKEKEKEGAHLSKSVSGSSESGDVYRPRAHSPNPRTGTVGVDVAGAHRISSGTSDDEVEMKLAREGKGGGTRGTFVGESVATPRRGAAPEASSGDLRTAEPGEGEAAVIVVGTIPASHIPGSVRSAGSDVGDLRRTTVSLDSADGSGFEHDPMTHLPTTLHFTILDGVLALTFALFVNAAILSVSAAAFNSRGVPVDELQDAYRLMNETLGATAGTLFALALLFAGQSSTITGTLAGQVVMEGFLGPAVVGKVKPWARRLVTRGCAILPAAIVCIVRGESGVNDLLVASQVALSVQLPFAVWPLVWFTARGSVMGVRRRRKEGYRELAGGDPEQDDSAEQEHEVDMRFVNSWWITVLAVLVASLLTGLNVWLLVQVALGQS
ncbi:hypothetical protein HDU93_005159 [Gonapodya sp. JEL0774]|nr:hypothetical protein HDU93_005159 [Gonapodya sp. JEL0774]